MLPDLSSEFLFKTSRSSGSGGQNVNKVSTKVELIFNIANSSLLSESQKGILEDRLVHRIRKDGAIHLVSQSARTQLGNKEVVIERFYQLIEKALQAVKKRRKSKISREEKEKRLQGKKIQSQKKAMRRKPEA